MRRNGSLNAEVQWRRRLKKFDQSNLTVAEYCDREGISNPSFYRWRKRLQGAPTNRGQKSSRPRTPRSSKQFVEVNVAATQWATVELPNGVRVRVPANNLEALRAAVLVGSEQSSGGSSC